MTLYNTDINIIGSIPDYNIVSKAIALHSQTKDALEDCIIKNNEFDFRTEKSRKRFVAALYSAFINFKNEHHKELIEKILMSSLFLILNWRGLKLPQKEFLQKFFNHHQKLFSLLYQD